jgi:hypothetical protein
MLYTLLCNVIYIIVLCYIHYCVMLYTLLVGGYPALLGSKTFPVSAPVPAPVTVSRSRPRLFSRFFCVSRFKPNFQNEFFKLLTLGRPPQSPPEYPQQS